MQRFEWILLLLLLVSSIAMTLLPWWVMDPRRMQSQTEIEFAYAARSGWASVLAFMSLLSGAVLCLRRWSLGGVPGKLLSVPILVLLGLTAYVANTNLLAALLPPMDSVGYIPAGEVEFLEPADELLALEAGGGARAYPLKLLAYHHVINTTVGDRSAVVAWCSAQERAKAWDPELEPDKVLHLTLAGFINRNVVLEDEETHTWWYQESGKAFIGPLQGRAMKALPSRITTLSSWEGDVLDQATNSVLVPPHQGMTEETGRASAETRPATAP